MTVTTIILLGCKSYAAMITARGYVEYDTVLEGHVVIGHKRNTEMSQNKFRYWNFHGRDVPPPLDGLQWLTELLLAVV